MINKLTLTLLCCLTLLYQGQAQQVERAEPLSWWIGMETPLQIMFYGNGLGDFDVRVVEEGVSATSVHKAESPNYLFVDVDIDRDARPGFYTFEFSRGKHKFTFEYLIEKRREGSALRGSFSSADMIYLLMPDRFANGDPSNDSTGDTAEKAGRGNPNGRHGGDIQGIINHLDYIARLGVTALWCTPLLLDDQPTYSYHGYACADYYRMDPRYGNNELYREMVRRAHERGIKVIMDVVTNHCGTAHRWMNDIPFASWVNNGGRYAATNHASTAGFDPNASKSDLREFHNGWFDRSMPDMAIDNPYLSRYFKQAFVWWTEWADLDGLRVDTYPYNEKNAMADWTASMLKEYPGLNIVGECWTSVPAQTAYWDGSTVNSDGFSSHLPSVMDFSLQDALCRALSKDSVGWNEGVSLIYNSLAQDFVYKNPRTLMIFLDNHDTERFADIMGGNAAKVKLGLTMVATMRGTPQLYCGTELMFRSSDLRLGHGGARIDFPGGWEGDPVDFFDSGVRPAEVGDVYAHAEKLFNWRKAKKVVHDGKTMHFQPRDNVYSYYRYDDRDAVLVIVNASRADIKVDWRRYGEISGRYSPAGKEVISGKAVRVGEELTVPALSAMVMEFGD